MSTEIDEKIILSKSKKLDQIRLLKKTLDGPEILEKTLQNLLQKNKPMIRSLRQVSIGFGHFYEFEFIELSNFVGFLIVVVNHLLEGTELPTEIKDKNLKWLDLENEENVYANFVGAHHVLIKSILAINAFAKPTNQLLNEGYAKNDLMLIKQAVKIDPIAVTSPQVSSMMMLSELLGKKTMRTTMCSALKNPRISEQVLHGKLRYIVWALHKEGLLKDMSEKERNQFLCIELGLYKSKDEDHFDSLNRLIRRWEKEFRT